MPASDKKNLSTIDRRHHIMNVLLLRNPPQGTPDRYHECLSSLGFSPHSIPVLDTVLTGFERMKDILLGATYDGVIVTSSRSAEAWKEVVGELLKNDLQSEACETVPFGGSSDSYSLA